MMSYATITELRARIGQSVFDEIYGASDRPDQSDRSDAVADLESAGAEVDGTIATRYRLPVQGERTLALLRDWTLTLAEERAYARAAGSAFAEKVKSRVAQVRTYLGMIRDGSFRLPDAEERKDSSVAFASCKPPVFGRDNMKGF